MPMLGFAPLNPSLLFLRFHVRTLIKLTSLPNNYVVLPVSGGITIVPCNRMVISWEEFWNAFRAHHIPEGLMEWKLNEFLALTQGTRTVLQYAQAFNHLCQYAGYHADSDTKKQDCFCRVLSTKLKERLNLVKANTFSELDNMALTQEDCITAHRAEKKQRISTGPASVQPSRYRFVQNAPPRAPQRNAPFGRLVFRPPQQQGGHRPPVPPQQP
jgi:hypothetical protein